MVDKDVFYLFVGFIRTYYGVEKDEHRIEMKREEDLQNQHK